MTAAIVMRDRILADSRLNDENQPLTTGKIFKRRGGGLIVTAGDSKLTHPFERSMVRCGREPDAMEVDDDVGFDGVLLTPQGEIIVYDRNFAPFKVSEPWVAIGSAYMVLRSWMLDKPDPVKAMRKAIEVDKECGYPIQVAYLNGKTETVYE